MNAEFNDNQSRHYSDDESDGAYIYSNTGWSQINPTRRTGTGIGCWALIAIVLIVLIFGNMGDKEMRRDMNRLQILIEDQKSLILKQSADIAILKSKVDELTDEVRKLQ